MTPWMAGIHYPLEDIFNCDVALLYCESGCIRGICMTWMSKNMAGSKNLHLLDLTWFLMLFEVSTGYLIFETFLCWVLLKHFQLAFNFDF